MEKKNRLTTENEWWSWFQQEKQYNIFGFKFKDETS